MKQLLFIVALTVAGIVGTAANAAVVRFDAVTASWININPVSPYVTETGNGTAAPSMNWGINAGYGLSGYDFDAGPYVPHDVNVPPNSGVFTLASFTHRNQPIYAPALDTVTLEVNIKILIDGVDQGWRSFYFDFDHDETPNVAQDCCNDLISVGFNNLSEDFTVGSDTYTVDIIGFETSPGVTTASFSTVESQINTANLIATVAYRSDVGGGTSIPEPAALGLFGIGLAGLGLAARRRKRI